MPLICHVEDSAFETLGMMGPVCGGGALMFCWAEARLNARLL